MGKGDILIHMGDVCIGRDYDMHKELMEATKEAKSRILIKGNHDKKTDTWYLETGGWDLVVKQLWIQRFGYDIILTHEPYDYAQHSLVPWGNFKNLHGHTHGNGHRSIDVAHYYQNKHHVELALENNNYRPFLLNQKLIEGK